MRWDEIRGMPCSVARTLSVIGDRWTLLVLRDAFLRTRRFEDFQRQLGITRHLLAGRLRKLVAAGILERIRYQEKPARYEYKLTEKGRDLYPVIVALLRWGDRWMSDESGPPLTLVHKSCGHTMHPTLVCPDCGEPIGARDVAPGRAGA
ncbi:MAG: helix-turn-helix domain-containing protein [Candidatus Binatia bacterium]